MKSRIMVPELMDDPGLCPKEHARALAGLRRINFWSGTTKHLAREILQIACRAPQSRWRILDLGCANGELVIDLAKALEGKLSFQITGWDMSPLAIEHARKRTQQLESRRGQAFEKLPVAFEVRNVFDVSGPEQSAHSCTNGATVGSQPAALAEPPFDIVFCTLFLHHFNDHEAIEVLRAMKRLARTTVLVDDLRRTRLGWWLAYFGCHLLSRSPVVHFDGPQSVRAALTLDEARAMALSAGLAPVSIRKHWPERYTIRWDRERC